MLRGFELEMLLDASSDHQKECAVSAVAALRRAEVVNSPGGPTDSDAINRAAAMAAMLDIAEVLRKANEDREYFAEALRDADRDREHADELCRAEISYERHKVFNIFKKYTRRALEMCLRRDDASRQWVIEDRALMAMPKNEWQAVRDILP